MRSSAKPLFGSARVSGSGSRTAILLVGVATLLMFGTIYAWSIFIAPLEAEFGWTRSQTSLTFSVAMIALSLGMLCIGWLSRFVSLRMCFVASTLLVAAGLLACCFVDELWQIYVFYGVFCGFGSGMGYTVWTTNVLAWYGDKVGFASGVLVMGFGMGAAVLGSIASGLIYSPLGWRAAFAVIALAVVVEGFGALWFIRTPPPAVRALQPKRDRMGVNLPASRVVKEPSFWLFCIWRSFVMGIGGAVIAEASVMMTGIGSSVALATLAACFLGAANGFGRPIGGILYDAIGQHKTLVVFPVLALVVSIAMAVSYRIGMPLAFAGALLVEGLVYGMFAAINTSYMRTTFGQDFLAANTGVSAIVLAPFNLVFPLAAAWVFETTGGYGGFFAAVPVFAALSLAAGMLCKPANRHLAERWGSASQGVSPSSEDSKASGASAAAESAGFSEASQASKPAKAFRIRPRSK